MVFELSCPIITSKIPAFGQDGIKKVKVCSRRGRISMSCPTRDSATIDLLSVLQVHSPYSHALRNNIHIRQHSS